MLTLGSWSAGWKFAVEIHKQSLLSTGRRLFDFDTYRVRLTVDIRKGYHGAGSAH